ncbi:DUF159-domain-containing protein [Westerdykella ornata]|uniref:DUF159-domain-containing protein n=1 Tax=Westerdykella ornata TaxID=318751 RepID=A0A6A6JKH8_WESOR|nr:DUF159-domain-containing protein [Westerdykella ornata]KAF2276764.1 DUF159-domain-containing protein [Westerdykella ornata]
MCGRYALALRPSEVRRQLEQSHMPVEEAPEDEDSVRETYNFAPGYHGLVYRAHGPEYGGRKEGEEKEFSDHQDGLSTETSKEAAASEVSSKGHKDTKYKLQAMRWGLIPFWTKRNPDYGSMMKTINCRDDSLIEDRGMWTSMKRKKRCIVVAQGFYEWLKKPGSKEKIPHFVKRRDGQLMCMAGLWDCVQYEDSNEKIYTYTIITTNSNKQLSFLHDRMPVILDNGSEAIRTWLHPERTEWSNELQSLLKPFEGALECYPVSKEVGKVGNNSPSFVIPVNSAENKSNIANFFGNQRKKGKTSMEKETAKKEGEVKDLPCPGIKAEHDIGETRETTFQMEGTEDNAPLPIPGRGPSEGMQGVKREHGEVEDEGDTAENAPPPKRRIDAPTGRAWQSPSRKAGKGSTTPTKPPAKSSKTHSATSNASAAKASPAKGDGNRKITSFFGK